MTRKKKKSPLARAGFLLLGAFLGVLAIEAGFWIAGAGLRLYDAFLEARRPDGQVTVLCEGDSFTYGVGGESYPSQLEQILNTRADCSFKVINKGKPGNTSWVLAANLEKHLLEFRPQVVIVLIGNNNNWNSLNLAEGLGRLSPEFNMDRYLLRSRVYRFFKLLRREAKRRLVEYPDEHVPTRFPGAKPGFEAAMAEAVRLRFQGDRPAAERAALKAVEIDPSQAEPYNLIAENLRFQNRQKEALRYALEAVRLDPDNPRYHAQAARVYTWIPDFEKMSEHFKTALRLNPRSNQLRIMAESYEKFRRLPELGGDIADIPGIRENPSFEDVTEISRLADDDMPERMARIFRQDAESMRKIAAARGARLIFCAYPELPVAEIVRPIAERNGIAYVDFTALFPKRFASRAEWVAYDNAHCNTKGYGYMAEVLAEEVRRGLDCPPEAARAGGGS